MFRQRFYLIALLSLVCAYFARKQGLILIWLVQHAGFPGKGGESQEAFRRAALERFGK
ncbi:MAG: hypothetical protein ABI614_25915 [Planctomycetota bacterium]